MQREGKIYTQIKIDEITNLGAVNIRLRSLFAALELVRRAERRQPPDPECGAKEVRCPCADIQTELEFTQEMKATHYTILIPNMAPIHFEHDAKRAGGARATTWRCLRTSGHAVAQEGLKYVHNDTCYPALLVIGQLINALNSGKYDLDHTALHHHPDRRRVPGLQLHPPAA